MSARLALLAAVLMLAGCEEHHTTAADMDEMIAHSYQSEEQLLALAGPNDPRYREVHASGERQRAQMRDLKRQIEARDRASK